MRIGESKRATALRLACTVALVCALVPTSAPAEGVVNDGASKSPSVSIELPTEMPKSAEGWDKPPLIAQLIPQGPGVVWYRFGAGPGAWQPSFGNVVIPPGKQLLSTLLVAPDGTPGPITTLIARSDVHADIFPSSTPSRATYTGTSSAAGVVTVSVLVGRQLGTIIRRLWGQTLYGTSTAISSSTSHSNTVIIATGERFPDALTASGLAGCLDAPVLLVHYNAIPSETAAEIKRLRAKHVVICGGPSAVSNGVATKLKSMRLSVERIWGRTRFDTAVEVSKRIQKLTGRTDRVFIARGYSFSDALIIAPLAYKTRTPILISDVGRLWDVTAKRVAVAHYSTATVIGNGLSARVESDLRARVPSVNRWSGSDQYGTGVQVAANATLEGALSWNYVGIARGDIFPDALCGGALCGKQGGVILLTPPHSLHPAVANALQAHMADVRRCEIYGGHYAVGNDVLNRIQSIFH